jgi:K+-sensing histidine kinase KdpD
MTASMDRFAVRTDQFRDQFIGVLSHDLRTPLGAITAGATLLAVPEDNPQRRSLVVTRIMNSAQRMERMIADLLDVTRARLGGSMPLKATDGRSSTGVRRGDDRDPCQST